MRTLAVLGSCLAIVPLALPGGHTSHTPTLEQRVLVLEHACSPVDTGGGVIQCANPDRDTNAQTAAIIDCLRNNAYSRDLLGQCIDDWFDANADRYGVDH